MNVWGFVEEIKNENELWQTVEPLVCRYAYGFRFFFVSIFLLMGLGRM